MQRLLELLGLREQDPTEQWPACTSIPLAFFLRYQSLNNVAIGDPYEKLSVFGRPSNKRPFKSNTFIYYPLGLIIEGDNNAVEYFSFVIGDEYEKKHTLCRVTLTATDGSQLELRETTNLSAVEQLLGPPEEKETDEEEIICKFRHHDLLLEFECNLAGLVRWLHVERWDST